MSPATALNSGDTTTAGEILAELTVSADLTAPYSRSDFHTWIDADHNGCDTRQEVLIAESQVPVTSSTGCTITAGQWYSWYDGQTWTNPSDVDIDHFVPLGEVWKSGGANWTSDERQDYANDLDSPLTLVAITDNVNESKGESDPAHWLPPLTSTRCEYATDWVLVKYRWNLTVDPTEESTLRSMLSGSCGATSVTVPVKGTAPSVTSSTTGVAAVNRISGADRYSVAVNISQNYTPGVPVVYIAKGTDYPDALSAAPAAAAGGGPLLLVSPVEIPSVVLTELRRLQPQKIVVVGGPGSVEPDVYDELSTLTPEIHRVGGADRYEASRNLLQFAFGSTGASRVYVSTGANFPDALSASAAAGKRGGAVLLVPGNASTIDTATADLITSLHPDDVAIAGGPGSVSPGIETSLGTLGLPGGVIRLSGVDRFEASRNINHDTFISATQVFLATGYNFPDALAGAPLAGRLSAPLYVIPGNCVPQDIVDDITAMHPAQITIFGGPASVSPAVETLTPCRVTTPPPSHPANPGDTKNCTDFATRSQAQAWFNLYYPYYGDVAKLDGNNNLIACESLPGAP